MGIVNLIQVSRKTFTIGIQSILNISLAGWLYNEYVHNRFMQNYLANAFSSVGIAVPIGLLASAAIAGGSFTVYSRRHQVSIGNGSRSLRAEVLAGSEGNLAVLDTCPFCSVPLKNISENRFQCRKCRRYFKK
ncbi:hypothetical protein E6H35_08045 [Candidatus Bathyarchaeota archaeon]|nr:MAG: hypothetical protein E6H35_08045 [Candidatus Bathyarchaeota archaeon]